MEEAVGRRRLPGPSSGSAQPLEAEVCSTPRWEVREKDSPRVPRATRQKGLFLLELRQGMEAESELGFKEWHRTGKKSHSRLMGQLSGAESLTSMEYSGNS